MPELLILFTILNFVPIISSMGEKCNQQEQCTDVMGKGYCRIGSPTCGSGICDCVPGWAWDELNSQCKKTATFGQYCDDKMMCLGENIACIDGKCQCDRGWRTGPIANQCIREGAIGQRGFKCYDSNQCLYNLRCIDLRCDCPIGLIHVNNIDCRQRTLDDSCSNDLDCSQGTPNTICSNGKCVCRSGYKETSYMVTLTQKKKICLPPTTQLLGEGAICNTTVSSSGSALLCKEPFVCEKCGGGVMTCSRLMLFNEGEKASLKHLPILFFLVFSSMLH